MAKKIARSAKRSNPLPDPDDFYFDDDLDVVTRGLPTEAEYAAAGDEESAPADTPVTEGVGRIGIRMVGLPPEPEELDDESVLADAYPDDGDYPEDEATETVYASRYSALPDEDESADDFLTPRDHLRRQPRNAAAQPMPARKQQRAAEYQDNDDKKHRNTIIRRVFLVVVTVILLGMVGMMMLSRTMMQGNQLLQLPERAVSSSVGPVQNFFSGLSESVFNYFRTLKYRANLEQQYLQVVAENEQLAIDAAFAEEYKRQLSMYQNMYKEINAGNNMAMNPLICQIIGREQGNYFSTFTINQGSRSGIEPYMAVTVSGALVGYTEEVYETTSTVRTIIDSGASIAGLIRSSRDQGIISGTLGVDGTALCRMYYLPDDHLPRPGDIVVTSGIGMSFPKGIPIGTVRESTRGTDANKKFVVVEPSADFEHLEFVVVYRYKPAAQAVEGRDTTSSYTVYVPTETARPYPTLRIGTTLKFGETPTPTVMPSTTPSPTPSPTPTQAGPVYEYQSMLLGPTPTPSPTPTPAPTELVTIAPGSFTHEED